MGKFKFTCERCKASIDNGKRYDVSISEMEDEQLGLVVVSISMCHKCKQAISKELNKQ